MYRNYFFFFLLLSCFGRVAALPPYEIRAVWLATVYGLDWPHTKAVDRSSRLRQQKELTDMLDSLQAANFNTVFLQARLRGDVIYPSAIEARSSVFTGTTGGDPGYDPLAFAVEECHKRGLECHAWFVTFPLGTDKSVRAQGKRSPVKSRASLCKRLNGAWYLDPGVPGTSTYLLSLVEELVSGYDIDGIHFDYIRYPEEADRFPDKKEYARYGKGRKLADWRRENIDRLVGCLYDRVKQLKPWVQVSSAPLGKYRRLDQVPGAGWTAYESVYQDPQRWLAEGKQDLIVPMMYYLYDHFFPFVDDWVAGSHERPVVPGLGVYRLDKAEGDWEQSHITDQIDYSRYFGASGNAFFRCRNLLQNTKGLFDELKSRYYRYPAKLPPLVWLNDSVPASPSDIRVERQNDCLKISWTPPAGENVPLTYAVYAGRCDSVPTDRSEQILAAGLRRCELFLPVDTARECLYFFQVTAFSRYRVESAPSASTAYYLSPYRK